MVKILVFVLIENLCSLYGTCTCTNKQCEQTTQKLSKSAT